MRTLRNYIHGAMIGALSLTLLFGHLYVAPPKLTQAQVIDALAATIDERGEIFAATIVRELPKPPALPCRKRKDYVSCEIEGIINNL